ncbi:MAG TPA: DNA-3-methyladenine glycosylase 2 family protein [Acidimicrobiia bacterium]|jgi:DNA-3-methyladenine glycosylase II
MDAESAFRSSVDRLAASDVHLGRIVDDHGRPQRFSRPASFQTLILLILEQQVSLDSARAAYDRLEQLIPGVEPVALARLSDQQLRDAGFSRQKTRYARELADRILSGRLDPVALTSLRDDEVRVELTAVPGIGPWTADVFLMSSLGRPDVWPIGDRALQVAAAEALGLADSPGPAELDEIGERWRPHRTVAAQILWHGYLSARNRAIPGAE